MHLQYIYRTDFKPFLFFKQFFFLILQTPVQNTEIMPIATSGFKINK